MLRNEQRVFSLGQLLLLVLVAAWLVVLVPGVFRRGDERSTGSLDAARARLASLHRGQRQSTFHVMTLSPGRSGSVVRGNVRGSKSAKRRRQVVAALATLLFVFEQPFFAREVDLVVAKIKATDVLA